MKTRNSDMVLRCAKGHEWLEVIKLPMSLTAYAERLKGFACCPQCSDKHVVMLFGKAYEEAKTRIIHENILEQGED